MPDSAVVVTMRQFKADLLRQERTQMREMARRWLAVERRLDGNLAALAERMAAVQRDGGTITNGMIYGEERYRALISQLTQELDKYSDYAERTIEQRQRQLSVLGINHAESSIRAQGVGVGFDRLPVEAVQNMVGLAGNRSPLRSLLVASWPDAVEGLTQALINGVALGYNPRKVAREMARGTARSLDRMMVIARTEQLRVYRQANRDSYIASGVVTSYKRLATHDSRVCAACLMDEGHTYELGEEMPEHPQGRCLTPGTIVSGPKATSFVSRYYVGEVVEITTTTGKLLTVTPNHPVLTSGGWVAAQFLKPGDQVISGGNGEGIAASMNPDEYQVPIVVEDIPCALGMERLAVVPAAAKNFHGDGVGSDVYVVWANGLLRHGGNAALIKPLPVHDFAYRNVGGIGFPGFGNVDSVLQGMSYATRSILRDSHAAQVFFGRRLLREQLVGFGLAAHDNASLMQAQSDDVALCTVCGRETVFGFPSQVASDDFGNGQFGALSIAGDPSLEQLAIKSSSADSVGIQDALGRAASNVVADCIVNVGRVQFSGHVYNLQTSVGWYIANGIITHNCTMVPLVEGVPNPTWKQGEAWFREQSPTTQTSILGKGRYDAWQAGKFDLGEVVTVRPNPTWGPSLQVTSLGQLTGPRVMQTIVPPAPTWSPSMDRATAERWAANSAFKDDVYHITPGVANERSIKANGFDLSRQKFGRVFGDGVYVTPNEEVAKGYEKWIGRSARKLAIKLNIENPYTYTARSLQFDRVNILQAATRMSRKDALAALDARGLSGALADAGYDALRIIPPQFESGVGGDQIIVFDPKKVVVIND